MELKTLRYATEETPAGLVATITFDEQGSPVNTMCQPWQDDLAAVTEQVVKDKDRLRGLILASAKSTFFAGADLKGVMRLRADDAPKVYAEIERVKRCFRTLETLGIPVVSCINGSALGGGMEVALVGHHRIAVDDPKLQLGLPDAFQPAGEGLNASGPQLLVATIIAFVLGYASVAWLLKFVVKHSLNWFVGYRIVLGLVLFGLLAGGVVSAT